MPTSGFQKYLLTDERELWTGCPPVGLRTQPRDWFLIPFSLFWAGFIVFWNVSVWLQEGDTLFRIWGLPFLLAGLYIVFGRFLHDAYIRKHEAYAVTNRRILILRDGRTSKLKSIDIKLLPGLELQQGANGRGTITFSQPNLWGAANGVGTWVPSLDGIARLVDIEDVRRVYELIEGQRA
jgi:hypothetical protein